MIVLPEEFYFGGTRLATGSDCSGSYLPGKGGSQSSLKGCAEGCERSPEVTCCYARVYPSLTKLSACYGFNGSATGTPSTEFRSISIGP